MSASNERLVPRITPGTVLSRQLASQQERFSSGNEIEIRDHQQEAMKAIDTFLTSDKTAGHVEMATATGKTFLISTIAQAAADLGMRTLILAPTVRIAEQLYGEDGQKGLGKFTDLHETGRTGKRFGDKLSTRSLDQPVVITTYQSLNNLYNAGLAPTVDLLIADEAHRSLGELTSKTMTEFSPSAIKIGFTATPSYSEDKSLDQVLPEKIFTLDIRDSVERGLTPPIRSIIYETGEEIPLLDPARDEFSEREPKQLIALKARNEAIIKFSKNFVEAGLQGAVACLPGSNLAHARLVAHELNNNFITDASGNTRAIKAESVGVHQSQAENDQIIAAYDNGEIDVVTFVYGLEQGWDSERPQFMINASPTTSAVRETQLLGRLLRGDDEVFFVDFLDIAKKQQYTSLHVLGEEKVEIKRRIGGHRIRSSIRDAIQLGDILDAELYDRLQITDGKLVKELYVGQVESETERLMYKWNRTLAQEGLSEDLPALFAVPTFAMRAFLKAQEALGDDAPVDELTEYATDHQTQSKKLSFTGMQPHIIAARLEDLNQDPADIDDYEFRADDKDIPEIIDEKLLKQEIDTLLSSLSEREAGVISMRFGLRGDDVSSLEEIATVYEVTRERIRQIEIKTMDKLRHFSRSDQLIDFLYDRALKPEPREPLFIYNSGKTDSAMRMSLHAIERHDQSHKAIRDAVKGLVPNDRDAALVPLEAHIISLQKKLRSQEIPDPLVEDELVGAEGYLAGLYEFFRNPAYYYQNYSDRK